MSAPLGTFVGFTRAELVALRAEILTRITSGKRVSISAGGKSSTKSVTAASFADIQQVLVEINYALNKLDANRKGRADTVSVDMRYETYGRSFPLRA